MKFYMTPEFSINNLPTKNDFVINTFNLMEEIKKSYLDVFNKWQKGIKKESSINIHTNIKYDFTSDQQRREIYELFKSLGFDENDIKISFWTDTMQLYVRLKVIN